MQAITKQQFRDPIADAQFLQAESTLLSAANTQAASDGQQNLPKLEPEFHARYVNSVFPFVQQLLDEHAQRSQNVSGMLMASKLGEAAERKLKIQRATLLDDELQFKILNSDLEVNSPTFLERLGHYSVAVGLICIAASEGIINYPCFRAAAMSEFNAAGAAIGVAISVAIGAPLGAHFIRNSKAFLQSVLRVCAILLGYFILFFCLGLLRLHYFSTATSVNIDASEITSSAAQPDCIAAWAICLTSFFLFALALFASIRFHKTKEESKSEQLYHSKRKKLRALTENIKNQKQQILSVETSCRQEQSETLASYEFALAHQRRLMGLGTKAINAYIATNLRYRTDGLCPEFFSRLPEHAYTSVFQQSKNQ